MTSLVVSINGKLIAAVSRAGCNIIAVQVHGDVKSEELAQLQVIGGSYESKESDTHLIWVNDHEIKEGDEVVILFSETAETSHPGKTIDELFTQPEQEEKYTQSMDDLFSEIAAMPKLKEGVSFELAFSSGDLIRSNLIPDEYSFHLSAMWRWIAPDEVNVSLTSNSIEGIKEQRNGRKHANVNIQYGQDVRFRVRT